MTTTETKSRKGTWPNNLRKVRERAKMNQTALAEHIGRSQRLISAIEDGAVSGRLYMDEIAEFFGVTNPVQIFPYYNSYTDFYTFEEAAERLGVSSSMISKRVQNGEIPTEEVRGAKLIPKRALKNVRPRRRATKSLRRLLIERLAEAGDGGLTSAELVDSFGPFQNAGERAKAAQNVQTILSRTKLRGSGERQFIVDKAATPPRWTLNRA